MLIQAHIVANSAILESPWYPFGARNKFGKADVIIKTSTVEDEAVPKVGLDLDTQLKAGPWGLSTSRLYGGFLK